MRRKYHSQPIYRYNLTGGYRLFPENAEEERERCYAEIRCKLPQRRLNHLAAFNIMVLVGIIAAFFLGSLLMEKPTISKIEKRDLAKFPEVTAKALFSGQLTRDIDVWFSDTFPFREAFVGLSAVVDESRGVRVDDVRIVLPSGGEAQDIPPEDLSQMQKSAPSQLPEGQLSALPLESSSEEERTEASSNGGRQETPPPQPEEPAAPPTAINNGTFVYKGMAMSLFGGTKGNADWYAEVLNSYKKELPGVQIYDMVIPTAIDFYVPEKYRDLTQSQKAMADYIYSQLDPGIKTVDAWTKLNEHKDEYLYFRTDHHWTGLGAYYAYLAFCETAGLTPVKLEDCDTRRLEDFIGTMYSTTQDSTLLQNPDYVDYYIFPREYEAQRFMKGAPYTGIDHNLWGEYAVSPNSYSVFLQGDFPLVAIKTDLKNGRKIMVVKESFGNAFAPFLINNYEEVYVVDQRYFELSAIDFIRQKGINELVFANNSFAACTPYHIQKIDGIRHQSYYSAPPQPAVTAPAPPPAQDASSAAEGAASSSGASGQQEQQPSASQPSSPSPEPETKPEPQTSSSESSEAASKPAKKPTYRVSSSSSSEASGQADDGDVPRRKKSLKIEKPESSEVEEEADWVKGG